MWIIEAAKERLAAPEPSPSPAPDPAGRRSGAPVASPGNITRVCGCWRCTEVAESTIGERIRASRKPAYTQDDLVAAAQISVDVIRKLEQGRRHAASIGTLQRIARALDVDIAVLLGSSRPMSGTEQKTATVIVTMQGLGDAARVWLTFSGAIETTVVMTQRRDRNNARTARQGGGSGRPKVLDTTTQ